MDKGYVKLNDDKEQNRRLIKVNELHPDITNDNYLYDLKNNELGKITNEKFIRLEEINILSLGRCYHFNDKGHIKLYPTEWLLKYLKDAATKHVNNTKTSDDTDLIIFD